MMPNRKHCIIATFLGLLFASQGFPQPITKNLRIHGFLNQGYLYSTKNNYLMETKDGNLEYNEAAINFSIQINAKLRGGLQLLSRDFGEDGNNETSLDWGYIDYHWKDALGLRAGKIKRPSGLYNTGRDIDALRTFVMLPQSVYDESMREITLSFQGTSIYGNLSLGSVGNLDYEAYYGTSNMDYDMTFTKRLVQTAVQQISQGMMLKLSANPTIPPQARLASNIIDPSIHMKHSEGVSLIWNTPITGLRLGATRMMLQVDHRAMIDFDVLVATTSVMKMRIPYESEVHYKAMDTFSGEFNWHNLTLAAEFYSTDGEVKSEGEIKKQIRNEAYYGQATYRLNKFEIGSYYSVYYPDSKDKEGKHLLLQRASDYQAWQKDLCFAIRYDLTGNWLIKGEAHMMDGTSLIDPSLNENGTDQKWQFYALKTSFTF